MNTVLTILLVIDIMYRFLEKKSKQRDYMQIDIDRRRKEAGWEPAVWPQRKLWAWPLEKLRVFLRKVYRTIMG